MNETNIIIAEKLFGYTKFNWKCGVTNEKTTLLVSPEGKHLTETESPNYITDNSYVPSLISKLNSQEVIVTIGPTGLNSTTAVLTGKNVSITVTEDSLSKALSSATVKYLQQS